MPRRIVSVIDPVEGDLVAPDVYRRRLAERTARSRCAVGSPVVMLDIPPWESFKSVVDGSTISSREELRQHNARNGVEDVGNDPQYLEPLKHRPEFSPIEKGSFAKTAYEVAHHGRGREKFEAWKKDVSGDDFLPIGE